MPLAGLYNIPNTPEELSEWTFQNNAQHVAILQEIFNQYNVVMPQYILDPVDPSDQDTMEVWVYNHQQMHQNQNQVLGIQGFDLTDVDWQDEGQRAAWIQLHANEHYIASQILGIG